MPAVSDHQCHLPVPISATSMPHSSSYQCTSMQHISAHLSFQSVPPINASQCRLSVLPQCLLISGHHCSLISAHQRRRKITYLLNFL
ncbi:unnamed protein product, partial [Staurois parvus]